jgi:hypothetical protein
VVVLDAAVAVAAVAVAAVGAGAKGTEQPWTQQRETAGSLQGPRKRARLLAMHARAHLVMIWPAQRFCLKLRVEYRKEQAADKPSGLTKVRRVLGADGRKSETALSVMRNGRHVKANKGVKGSHHFE